MQYMVPDGHESASVLLRVPDQLVDTTGVGICSKPARNAPQHRRS